MSMKDKLRNMLKGHEDKAAKGIDAAGSFIDRRTHGKYRSQVGKAQSKLKDELGRPQGGERPGGEPGTQPGQGPERGQGPEGQGPYGDQGRPPQS